MSKIRRMFPGGGILPMGFTLFMEILFVEIGKKIIYIKGNARWGGKSSLMKEVGGKKSLGEGF